MAVDSTQVSVTYVQPCGSLQSVRVAPGSTLMQAAVDNLVPGIDADCGGECRCGTCHCYIDEAWLGKLGPVSEDEEAMIGCAMDARPNSRLSCQVVLTSEMNGLRVLLPER